MLSQLEVREALVEVLSRIEGYDSAVIEAAIVSRGGDDQYELDSKVAESVIAGLEVLLGVHLPGPADLNRRQFATIGALIRLVLPVAMAA